EPDAGVAVNVTTMPVSYEAEHVAPQSMPAGLDVTVPLPVPALLTDSGNVWRVKVAVTVVAALIVTLHVPVPVQPPPLQPANNEPDADVAVNVTTVPASYEAEHVAPQSMPAGLDVTAPLPAPALPTERGPGGRGL